MRVLSEGQITQPLLNHVAMYIATLIINTDFLVTFYL